MRGEPFDPFYKLRDRFRDRCSGDVTDNVEEPVEKGRVKAAACLGQVKINIRQILLGQQGSVGMACHDVEPTAAEGLGTGRKSVDL